MRQTLQLAKAMDVEALIAAVYQRPMIWDKRNKLHSNRFAVCKGWMEISLELSGPEHELRKKWKYLRDQFVTEWGKIPDGYSQEELASGRCSKWQYFPQLLFLMDVVRPRFSATQKKPRPSFPAYTSRHAPSSRVGGVGIYGNDDEDNGDNGDDNTSAGSDSDSALNFNTNADDNVDDDDDEGKKTSRASSSSLSKAAIGIERSSRKRKVTSVDKDNDSSDDDQDFLDRLARTRAKVSRLKEEQDDDHLFFRSLLPYIKRIPLERKLRFRSQITQTVEEFLYPRGASHTQDDPNMVVVKSSPSGSRGPTPLT